MRPAMMWRAFAVLLGIAAPFQVLAAPSSANERSIAQVRAVRDDAVVGTAVLVSIDATAEEPVLFFITALRLFDQTDGERPTPARLVTPGGDAMEIHPDDVIRPMGSMAGVAILRVTWPGHAQAALPLDMAGPDVRGVFVIAGFDRNGSAIDIPERVQYRATSAVTGDRAVAELHAPLGAPAISSSGVFGIITDWQPGRSPVITLLSFADRFLSHHLPAPVPRRTGAAAEASLFQVTEKRVSGPLLSVACGAENIGEIEVPYRLALNETAVDATASFTRARSVRLADVTVLALDDRTVRLRFTLAGVPPPAFAPPGPCLPGQALVTVRVNVVSFPRQE